MTGEQEDEQSVFPQQRNDGNCEIICNHLKRLRYLNYRHLFNSKRLSSITVLNWIIVISTETYNVFRFTSTIRKIKVTLKFCTLLRQIIFSMWPEEYCIVVIWLIIFLWHYKFTKLDDWCASMSKHRVSEPYHLYGTS